MGIEGVGQKWPWRAPTEVERQLYEAGESGDWPAYWAVLAGTDLFFPMTREVSDALTGELRFSRFHDPQVKGLCLAVFTRGMLPPPAGGQIFERGDLAGLARIWPGDVRWLALNPGTPVETFLPAEPRAWKRKVRKTASEPPLKTLWTGHLRGPMAHGLACGALLLVKNGSLWNHLGWQSGGYSEEKKLLKQWWGITGRGDWQDVQGALLRGGVSSPAWEFVLRVRQAMIREYGRMPGAMEWRETADRVLLSRTTELVDRTGKPPEFDLEADLALIQRLIGKVLRYEARFRADGILAGDAAVRSVLAWDFGRASCLARWGLGAGLCEQDETERAVLAAGEASRQAYGSWEEFSAGYILGRCLHFDSEEYGEWYGEMLSAHQLLTTDPESPWLSVPWPDRADLSGRGDR